MNNNDHVIKIAVLATVFNRKDVTLRGLQSFYSAASAMLDSHHFEIYLVDDGCTDGTGEAVLANFPKVNIISSKGGLFWGGGMNEAWKAASNDFDYDYYIWLNDDAELYPTALKSLFEVKDDDAIVSGVFEDKEHHISYGGKTEKKDLLPPGSKEEVFYMNGNLVLIPRKIYKKLGFIDSWFIHGGGDYDYGMRAKENGFRIVLTNDFVGMTDRHDEKAFYNKNYPLFKRMKMLYSKKSNPIIAFKLYYKHRSLWEAIRIFVRRNYRTILASETCKE